MDFSDPEHPQKTTLGGYCDYNGDQCAKVYSLPWSVNFGNGTFNRIVIHGNGLVDFVSGDVLADPLDNRFLYNQHGQLWAGFNNELFPKSPDDSQLVYRQSARYENLGDSARVTWFTCNTPKSCFENPYTATFTQGEINGVPELFVTVDWHFLPPTFFDEGLGVQTPPAFLYGTFGNGFSDVVNTAPTHPASAFFHIPALFAEVPEPATWAMMIMGFGGIGTLLRRRRTSAA